MKRKLKIYLDTSVINFLFADDAPEKKEVTIDFFENYLNEYEVYISQVVIDEINQTNNIQRKNDLLEKINYYKLKFIPIGINEEVIRLASIYLENKVLPEKSYTDSLHIALSVVNEIDILLSWNYKHMANINRKRKINLISNKENYTKNLEIITPYEVLDYEISEE
ncbi:MAG TPA: type II toxin-antitoxin system VapC family toxin [Candidatus Kapabacteria bacterium]|nr:type II toxin-antitoxin system VapC family toxin [Candidatus Kapabacteria bacterium]